MKTMDLENSVQINNGFYETSADGAALVFDVKYGIMFCAYMPGQQGSYGESRGRICLSYFPASQPTNIKFAEIASGHTEYCNTAIGLGEGRVRVIYEKNSRDEGDHCLCFRDFDYLTGTLSDEDVVTVKLPGGKIVPLTGSVQFRYLEDNGCTSHIYRCTEQTTIAGCTIYKGEDGCHYGAVTSFLTEVILFRSADNLKTLEFFAIYPRLAQYEFDYKLLGDTIYALYRTDRDKDSIMYTRLAFHLSIFSCL